MLPETPTTTDETSGLFDLLNKRIDDEAFQQERKDRIEVIAAAQLYYDGFHPKPLKVRQGDKDPNVIVNLCRSIINKSVAWMFGDPENGEMLKFELPAEDKAVEDEPETESAPGQTPLADEPPETEPKDPNAEAEAWLEEVWSANGGAQLLQKIGRRASVAGHGFIKIIPQVDPENTTGLPRLVLQKSDMVSVLRKQDDTDVAEAFVIEWVEKRLVNTRLREVRVRQIIANLGSQWIVAQFNDTGRGRRKWVAEKGPDIWPYTWCPIVDWQNQINDAYYGLSDLEDLPTINDAINFSVSNTNRILFIHGHPRTIGIGIEEGEVKADAAIDAFWTVKVDKDKADIKNLEMQSDLGSAFAFVQFLVQAFQDIGRDLDLASLREQVGKITNFGLRVLANNALTKLGEKRLNYGRAINQINRILLELGGFPVQDTVIHWLDPLPEDSQEEVNRLAAEREMGIVSKQTAAEERGRDWEVEQERIQNEAAEGGNIGAELLKAFERGGPAQPLRRGPPAPQGPATINEEEFMRA